MIALAEAGQKFEARKVKLADCEQDSAWFRALTPLGRVPVLDIGDNVVTETIAMLRYAAHSNPDARLLPFGDPLAVANACEFMAWLANSVHVTIPRLQRTERFVDESAAAATAVKATAHERLEKAFRSEQRLGRAMALDTEFGLIDGYLESVLISLKHIRSF